MDYYLITKWFGCFLVDDTLNIVEKNIFPKNREKLSVMIKKIRNNVILDIENKCAESYDFKVVEKRLEKIGEYVPYHQIFKEFSIDSNEYGFSESILHDILFNLSKTEVNNSLCLLDYQVIQQVNALDELQHIQNMLKERIAAWNNYPNHEIYQSPIKNIITQVEKDQDVLRKQIETSILDLAPNISEIAGPMIAARLIAHAGSLKKLSMLPSSSVQLLGAEKALFRFKKQGGKPPKHGVIFQHPLISKVPFNQRGKNARLLSSKISIAAKADMFTKRFIAPTLNAELTDELKNRGYKH